MTTFAMALTSKIHQSNVTTTPSAMTAIGQNEVGKGNS
jgi:hypothetical protein